MSVLRELYLAFQAGFSHQAVYSAADMHISSAGGLLALRVSDRWVLTAGSLHIIVCKAFSALRAMIYGFTDG